MPHSLKDLTEVMEERSAPQGRPSPDLLPRIRHRIRRGARRRAAAGAAGTALVLAASFATAQQFGGTSGDRAPRPVMGGGVVNDAFTKSPSVADMGPVREVRYTTVGKAVQFEFVPTGPYSLITYRCSARLRIFGIESGINAVDCDRNGSRAQYLRTTPGKQVTLRLFPAPPTSASPTPSKPMSLESFAAAFKSAGGVWRVQAYSGACRSQACESAKTPGPEASRQPSVGGIERLFRTTATADGRPDTVGFTPRGNRVRLRLTCVDGAATAVVTQAGRARIVECEAAEDKGVVWDVPAKPLVHNELRLSVLPAEAGPVREPDDASLARMMKGVRPAGKWTLEIYQP
jgi:hypothetical protein